MFLSSFFCSGMPTHAHLHSNIAGQTQPMGVMMMRMGMAMLHSPSRHSPSPIPSTNLPSCFPHRGLLPVIAPRRPRRRTLASPRSPEKVLLGDGTENGTGNGIENGIAKKEKEANGGVLLLMTQEEEMALGEEKASLSLWSRIPQRYKLVLTTSLAFTICNMDKVNLSVAIIPMSHQFGWSSSTAGLVQSSFFWGYILSQLPGGWLAKEFSGKIMLGGGVLLWSLATAAVPISAVSIPTLLFCRLLVGLGEGVSPSAATDLIARAIPSSERSRAVAFVFSGLSLGSIIGLILAPFFIEQFGWEAVFYIFGMLGVLWFVGFSNLSKDEGLDVRNAPGLLIENSIPKGNEIRLQERDQEIQAMNKGERLANIDNAFQNKNAQGTPWKAFFKSPSVWAMIYAHFCGNWGHFNYLSWLPTYFSKELHLDLTNAALISVLPPLASIFISAIAAPLADLMISKGVDITTVRKLCQTIAFVSPAICMAITASNTHFSPFEAVSILTLGLSLTSFALPGLYCTHQDISPKYASILLGITNTAGAIPGIVGVYLTGYLLDQTQSWNIALFYPSIFFYVTGTIVWAIFASSKPQNFDL